MLKASVVALVAVLPLALVIQPSAAEDFEAPVVGVIERVIREAPGYGLEHPEHTEEDFHGTSSEEVYLITDDGRILRIPDSMAAGLEPGMTATALPSSEDPRMARTVRVLADATPRERVTLAEGPQQMPYALVSVRTPDTVGTPATISEVQRWLLDATEPYFDREVGGAFDFSVHSTHTLESNRSLCQNERESVAVARRQLALPEQVGIILIGRNETCSYAGIANLGMAAPGEWLILNVESPASRPDWSRAFYESQGRKVLIHEIGHNLGLWHSARWSCDVGTSPEDADSRECYFVEYGSSSSVMGRGNEWGALDAHQRWQLGVYGPGRMLSVEAGSGSAILLHDRAGYEGPDDGTPQSFNGNPVVMALHLRDGRGEVWIVAREPLFADYGARSPSGVTALLRTGEYFPIQADLVRDPRGANVSLTEYLAGQSDLIRPGATFTTPGGTRVTVMQSVVTPHGTGFLVEWEGEDRPPVLPSPPSLEGPGAYDEWLGSGARKVSFPEEYDDFQSCSIVGETGELLGSWRSGTLLPTPGPSWWSELKARSEELPKPANATLRMPLTGNPYKRGPIDELFGVPSTVVKFQFSPGISEWRTQCIDFQGRSTTSTEPMTVRVDVTPPRLAEGSLVIEGLTTQTSWSSFSLPLRVRVPAFADDESGFDQFSRSGACSVDIPADQAGSCEVVAQAYGKGRLVSGAKDQVRNTSDYVKVRYDLRYLPARPSNDSQWRVTPYEAVPLRRGAATTVSVKGRNIAFNTRCGKRTGVLEVSMNGGSPKTVSLKKAGKGSCAPLVLALPKARTSIQISYSKVGRQDALLGYWILK